MFTALFFHHFIELSEQSLFYARFVPLSFEVELHSHFSNSRSQRLVSWMEKKEEEAVPSVP